MFVMQKRLGLLASKSSRLSAWSRSLSSTLNGEQITLWHSPDARSLRCVWTLEEMGVTNYNLITMPFPPRFFYRDFLNTNVLGTIPYMTDGDVAMTESCGISQYLATKYGASELTVDPSNGDYAQYMNWIHHADATLTFPQTICLRYSLLEPGKCDVAADDYAKWYLARLRMLDEALSDGREFLVDNKFTVADICIAYALFLSHNSKLKLQDGSLISSKYTPQTKSYLERMMERPAFIKSREKQAESFAEFKKQHPPQVKK